MLHVILIFVPVTINRTDFFERIIRSIFAIAFSGDGMLLYSAIGEYFLGNNEVKDTCFADGTSIKVSSPKRRPLLFHFVRCL